MTEEFEKKRLRGVKIEAISDEELEQKYGYTKEHMALDELYYDTSLTREEKLELFSKLSPETLEKIPDKDLKGFEFERKELKSLLKDKIQKKAVEFNKKIDDY